ncbi:acyl carrier protein [Albidovulum sediminicola]|uniref:Phosphopantetheine-binding protein n=1 Tax=Albidovulum sediminicola TaxID=2984331 RepID=A0ABT2Z1Z8_9RHOB|nr:phosphopantetheine-binding protein [Defluviimonas sp. WL0075]MCV2865060.1 phosphopantetheine-binding protein [Defluviimonas sp. WL0075]
MTRDQIEQILRAELNRIAPDIAIDRIDPAAPLREEFDIDSIDVLTLVTALSKALKIDIPEADYPQMESYADLLDYLAARAG